MNQVTINLNESTYDQLKKHAELNGRSMADEISKILNETLNNPSNTNDLIRRIQNYREEVGHQDHDSTEYIREDRDALGVYMSSMRV